MTIEEVQAQLAKLQAEVEKLSGEKEWPQEDDYYSISFDGEVVQHNWFEGKMGRNAIKQGIYRTHEAAEMEALRRECRASRPKVDWKSQDYVHHYVRGLNGESYIDSDAAICFDIQIIDSGLYGRTEEEARERWNRYGKAFEYLISNQE